MDPIVRSTREKRLRIVSTLRWYPGFVNRTPDISSMRALGIRSSYKGRTVDALATRGDEGRGQLRKVPVSR